MSILSILLFHFCVATMKFLSKFLPTFLKKIRKFNLLFFRNQKRGIKANTQNCRDFFFAILANSLSQYAITGLGLAVALLLWVSECRLFVLYHQSNSFLLEHNKFTDWLVHWPIWFVW